MFPRSPFIMECLTEFYSTYDDNRLRWNGAGLLTRVARYFLRNKNASDKRVELELQPSFIFFPVSRNNIIRYFQNHAKLVVFVQEFKVLIVLDTAPLFISIAFLFFLYFSAPATESERTQQDELFQKMVDKSFTFHFWNSLTSALVPEPESLVSKLLNRHCIRCSDVL
ncbi:hypothetical protein RHGRI_036956 [Rhododendron griersonianum]|uniref:Alpha 1,4-glycosyltransferase domain-containing protein n=1 Tax=Rhododendron griersonianum TaxID=479676 RepID=A0AAV6HQ22_9ERIC|nr:hypothetical protein RHGRI_036956 [Rhododendron griersonianum]